MRLPLEILRPILDSASSFYTCNEFLQLRLANFRDIFFSYHGLESYRFYYTVGAVFGHHRIRRPLWDTVPAILGQKYLYHRVKRHRVESSLFAHLFVPVFERQLQRLGISERDHVTRHEKLEEWVGYCQHAHWKESWKIAHAPCQNVKGGLAYYDNCTVDDQPEKRIENDRKFLEICCAIVADDQEAALSEFHGFHSGVDDLNYCFGTTLLGFAIVRGSPDMLELLLRSVHSTTNRNLETYLQLAIARDTDSEVMLKILLDRLTSATDTKMHVVTRNLLLHAISQTNTVVFDVVISWMIKVPDFHGKLSVLESCYEHALSLDKTTDFLTYAAPHKHPGLRSTLDIASPHQLGNAYERKLKAKFITLEKRSPSCWRGDHWYKDCPWDDRHVYSEASRASNGFNVPAREKFPRSPTTLFEAVSDGLLNWVDWMLWAGADPRHVEGELSVLDFAWKGGRRDHVARLLDAHGWNVRELELVLYA